MILGFYFWPLFFSAIVSLAFAPSNIPSFKQTFPAMPLLLIFMVLLILPGTYSCIWGPNFLSPGIDGLLLMTEAVTGSFSLALLAGGLFGPREIIGVILITSSSILEPLIELSCSRVKFAGRN